MTKRHVDIDDDLLERVQVYYGTTSIKEAVNLALNEVIKTIEHYKMIKRWITYQDVQQFEEMEKELREERDVLSTRVRSYDRTYSPSTTSSSDCLARESSPPAP